MITFITSIRHPNSSHNYIRVWEILKKTLYSVCGQSNENFRVIVVANEILDDFSDDNRIVNTEFIEVDFPSSVEKMPEIPDRNGRWVGIRSVRLDKASKYTIGTIVAKKYDPSYVMFFDADDFIHRDLSEYVISHNNEIGYFISKGYLTKNNLVQKVNNFNKRCGTSNIFHFPTLLKEIRTENINMTSSQEEIIFANDSKFIKSKLGAHKLLHDLFASKYNLRDEIPFRAGMYNIETGENTTKRNMRGGIEISQEIKDEFNLIL
jgi:hypothetical protein